MGEISDRKYKLLDDKIECTTGNYPENTITVNLSNDNISEELLALVVRFSFYYILDLYNKFMILKCFLHVFV